MALPEDPFRNATGILDRTRVVFFKGGAAGAHVVTGINLGDNVLEVQGLNHTSGDVTTFSPSDWTVTADNEVTTTDVTTGQIVALTFYDADLGELTNIVPGGYPA